MKRKLFAERGQALILVAFGAIALFVIAGLAIDGSHKYSDRRHAQNAADTAALAGARSLARGEPQWELDALDRAQENGYDNVFPSNTVEVHNPPVSGYYNDCADPHYDCNDYVQVIITSNRETWFMRVLGIDGFTNVVQAVASKRAGYTGKLFGGSAVVALAPEGCALLAGGSNGTNVFGGGMLSNSASDQCSFKQAGCKGTVTVTAANGIDKGPIITVGGMQLSSNCVDQIDASLQMAAIKQQPFPPQVLLDEPAVCSTAKLTPSKSGNTATYDAGHYDSISSGGSIDHIILKPGIYCVDKQINLSNPPNAKNPLGDTITLQGTFGTNPGVFIYIRSTGSQNPISLQGGNVTLWADTDPTGAYSNYLIYVAPDLINATIRSCKINGGAAGQLRGTIYAPFCNIEILGGSNTGLQSQLIGYTVDLSGNSLITINYDQQYTPDVSIPLQVGLSK